MTRVNVERWRGHVTALRKSSMSVAQYAAKHGLSRHTLYAARRQVAAAATPKPKPAKHCRNVAVKAAPFVAVRVASSPSAGTNGYA